MRDICIFSGNSQTPTSSHHLTFYHHIFCVVVVYYLLLLIMGNVASKSNQPPLPNDGGPPCASGKEFIARSSSSPSSDCPIPEEVRDNSKFGVYNVYNQRVDDTPPASSSSNTNDGSKSGVSSSGKGFRFLGRLDPRNNMPSEANQKRAPGQKVALNTDREASKIPKSGGDIKSGSSTWQYPSAQMFYNALVRKGKAEDVDENDVATVVSVHNAMNEDTWDRVVTWEKLHPRANEDDGPKLVRFRGRPDELSPLAWARYLMGGGKPFDRHDWWIERGDEEIRYVIDYYFKEDKAGTSEQFELVVRPAFDSVEGAVDRAKMFTYVNCARFGVPCPITGSASVIGEEQKR